MFLAMAGLGITTARQGNLVWSRRLSTKGVDFLELWIERNVLPRSADRDQALRLAMKLESDATAEGLTLQDLELPSGGVEGYIRDVIVHVGEPGTPGD